MSLTLNQIVSRVQRLALSHAQINHFYFGDDFEFDANGEINYPACFLEMQPGIVDRTSKKTTYRFRLYLLDIGKVAEGAEENETEVLSDMSSVMQDMLALLMSAQYQDDWDISEVNNFVSVTEALNDMDAGVVADIGISVPFLADRCQVPADDSSFINDLDMARTKIVTYTGTSSESSTITVPGLSGKIVLASYRAGNYKRCITTVPVDFDKIGVTGEDLGNYKGILSSDGTVKLQVGDALIDGEVLDFIVWSN